MVSFVDSQRFSRFDPEDRDLLAALAKLDGFDAGEVVHSADTPSPFLNLITTGGVTLTLPTAQGLIPPPPPGPHPHGSGAVPAHSFTW